LALAFNLVTEITIKPISFEEILPIWSAQLWPCRKSIIEPLSAIDIDSNIDVDIFKFKSSAHYFGAFDNSDLIAVISGHLTKENECRLRGLFVNEKYRGKGISKRLIQTELNHAKQLKCHRIWALIRTKNLELFRKFGFEERSLTDKYEFGPHYIIDKIL
jgi:N-acetylglutamate synthase-like GNAT family acetyltransferase